MHRGFHADYTIAGIKATGTGAFGDYNSVADAGVPVLDFTDVGMATTHLMPMARIEAGFETLIAAATAGGAEVIVVEIADGVFQQETRAILQAGAIRDRMDGILFAAPDALSALGGVHVLEKLGLSPFAISGMVSLWPRARAEAKEVTGLPVLSYDESWDMRWLEAQGQAFSDLSDVDCHSGTDDVRSVFFDTPSAHCRHLD